MKKIIKSLLLSLALFFQTCIFSMGAPGNPNDYEQFAMDLFGSLSEDEQKQVLEEAMKLEEYIKGLPEEEQLAFEKELENELQNLMDSGALDEISKPQPQPIEKPAEPKKEDKETKEPELKFAQDIPALKKQLKKISKAISSLSLKIESPHNKKHSSEAIETWNSIKQSTIETQSYILIISNNNKLMDSLLGPDYKILKSKLEDFYKEITQQDKKLNITENPSKKVDVSNAVEFLNKSMESQKLSWEVKRFMEKFAPEEVKKIEAQRPIVTPHQFNAPNYPSGGGGGYYGDQPNNYPRPGRGGYTPPISSPGYKPGTGGLQRPTPQKPESKTGGGSRGNSKPGERGRSGDKKDDKKSGDKKDDKKGKPYISPIKKEVDSLKSQLEKVSKAIEEYKTLEKIEYIEKNLENQDLEEEKIASFVEDLIKLETLLSDPTRTAQKIGSTTKVLPGVLKEREVKSALDIFKDKKYEKYNKFKESLDKINGSIKKITDMLKPQDQTSTSTPITRSPGTVPPIDEQTRALHKKREPLYKRLENLGGLQKDIIAHIKGEYKKKEKKEEKPQANTAQASS